MIAAWAAALQRSDLRSLLAATQVLQADPEIEAFAVGTWTPPSEQRALNPHTRVHIPVIPLGADPGTHLRPACEILRTLRLDRRALRGAEALVRPFAYLVPASAHEHVPRGLADRVAILSRQVEYPVPSELYAVRLEGTVRLARVLWNARDLVVRAGAAEDDFTVIEARGLEALRTIVFARVMRVLDPSTLA